MDKRYAFLFPAFGSIQWSGESAKHIRDKRFNDASEAVLAELDDFFDSCESGDFITLAQDPSFPSNAAVICERA